MTFTVEDRLESFKDQGFSISHNPSGDGNYQFPALSYFLQKIDFHRSERSVCQEALNYQFENPEKSERQPLEYFVGLPSLQYLNSMAKTGTYGDHITLQTASNLCNIELQIVSSLENDARTLNQPQECKPITAFFLGHFAEGAK